MPFLLLFRRGSGRLAAGVYEDTLTDAPGITRVTAAPGQTSTTIAPGTAVKTTGAPGITRTTEAVKVAHSA